MVISKIQTNAQTSRIKSHLNAIETDMKSGKMAGLEAARILLRNYFGKKDP